MKPIMIREGETAYYLGVGSAWKPTLFWNRRKKEFQEHVCMDCVYPSYRGAAQQHSSYTSPAYKAWQRIVDAAPAGEKDLQTFWIMNQKKMEEYTGAGK